MHEGATPEVRQALDRWRLADPTDELRLVLPTDALVIVDDHAAFHGRTAFCGCLAPELISVPGQLVGRRHQGLCGRFELGDLARHRRQPR